MARVLALLTFIALAAASGFLFWRAQTLEQQLSAVESKLDFVQGNARDLSRQNEQFQNQIRLLEAGLSTLLKPAQTETEASPSPALLRFSIAQSYRLDRVVDWVALIEDKIFFILFPPTDPGEKDRRATELRARTEQVRANFDATARQERTLRDELASRLRPVNQPEAAEE